MGRLGKVGKVGGSLLHPVRAGPPPALELSPRQLKEVRDTLIQRLREGLRSDGREIPAKPSFLAPPTRTAGASERVMVVEWGGTHLRVASTRGDQVEQVTSCRPQELSSKAELLFEWQVEQLKRLGAEGQRLGYIFTFPAHFTPEGDATIDSWGKEVSFPELLGQKVGELLRSTAERQGLRLGELTVLDDSVAALLAGAARGGASMGVIAGTGTNIAAFFDGRTAPKLKALDWEGPMALSLETDRYRPPHLTPWDDQLDRMSISPGQSRYEKAVGGRYLPELFKLILPHSRRRPRTGEELAAVLADGSEEERAVARALYDRSADLVAAGLAAVAAVRGDREPTSVQAEGSMFKVPGYLERVQLQANRLIGGAPNLTIEAPIEQLNLLGALLATLKS